MSPFVLVIDDSRTIRTILQHALSNEGYGGVSFGSGTEALAWLDAHQGCIPTCILLDLDLPDMDGSSIIRLIRTRPALHNVLLIILSACQNERTREKALLAGADLFVAKPFTIQALLQVIGTRVPLLPNLNTTKGGQQSG